MNLTSTSLEWALKHIAKYYDSDFYPRPFEFKAIEHSWAEVKKYILEIDLSNYAPKSPFITLAPKKNFNFRVVHQLDPIDTLIYTAYLYEVSEKIESHRIPKEKGIACSYRIVPDIHGSFFGTNLDGYATFKQRSYDLADEYDNGYVVVCDITDFYNQIYLHRVSSILSEAGVYNPKVLEDFLGGLNNNVSRGIPVGPAASILIAEAIMADIDKKILTFTDSFTRYVDDMHVFFKSKGTARSFIHDLTKYLYSNHRLVLSSEKTFITKTSDFLENYLNDEERVEKAAIHEKLKELHEEGDYPSRHEIEDIADLESDSQFEIRSSTYNEVLKIALKLEKIDFGIMRHILRRAGAYRIRSILPLIMDNFEKLLPVIREVVIYLEKTLNERSLIKYKDQFNTILNAGYTQLPFINIWIYTLFQNPIFNSETFDFDYNNIIRIREQALVALRLKDTTWIKDHKDGLDVLGPWDKRAILYAAQILAQDELKHWVGFESSKGDILTKAVAIYSLELNQTRE